MNRILYSEATRCVGLLPFLALVAVILACRSGSAVAQQDLQPRVPQAKLTLEQMQSIPASHRVTVKFREGSGFRLQNGELSALKAAEVALFQKALGELKIPPSSVRRLFTRPPEALDAERLEGQRQSGKRLADLNLYYIIDLPQGVSAASIASKLNQLDSVEFAEPRRLPSPPPADPTPDSTSKQGYKDDPPRGIGVPGHDKVRGGDGAGMRAVDIEYSWRVDHEDLNLPRDRIRPIPGCEPEDPFGSDHGTAVLGEVIGARNAYGVTGIAPATFFFLVPANCTSGTGGYLLENAIETAASLLEPGDVIILEQQTGACGGACGRDQVGCGPVEAEQSVFDAIQRATSLGRIVVEAAGNGRVDLDGPACHKAFDREVRDSGAIVVGAGSAAEHARLSFSSYGSRADVQAWGDEVTTTGYGDAFSPSDEQRRYTHQFGGTSSATPIVSSAVLSINGVRRACGLAPALPAEMRLVLSSTGTPQANAETGHIGPLPNIRAALAAMPGVAACLPGVSPKLEAKAAAAVAPDAAKLIGRWMIADTGEVLSIGEGGRWTHPVHGAAKMRPAGGAADVMVIYEQGSARCSYRIAFSDGGKTLQLSAADPTQDSGYCPEGSLTKLGDAG